MSKNPKYVIYFFASPFNFFLIIWMKIKTASQNFGDMILGPKA